MRISPLLPTLLATGLCACVFVHASDEPDQKALAADGLRATANIESRSGSTVTGTATFTETKGGVLVEIVVHHTPHGWHAVHVHDKGDCSADYGSSAGGHFNPATKNHGAPQAPEPHAGDLGNLYVDEHGEGRHTLTMPDLAVADGPNSVRGRAIIVHAGVDDFVTQPTGNAGGRIGCGVIR